MTKKNYMDMDAGEATRFGRSVKCPRSNAEVGEPCQPLADDIVGYDWAGLIEHAVRIERAEAEEETT